LVAVRAPRGYFCFPEGFHDSRRDAGATNLTLRPVARRIVLHVYECSMKTNITLKIDASLLREVRILAAEEGTSISAMLAARLEQIVRERKSYDRSRRRALARLRDGMSLGWTPPRSRDELYER
jgi:hypothetical protein